MPTMNESAGKFYVNRGGKLLLPEDNVAKELDKLKVQSEIEEASKKLLELDRLKQEEINKKIETIELIPMGARVIILPYPKNPYRKIMQGSIIVDYNGEFMNPDSGEQDKLRTGIGCAKVIEVGPDCKYVKPGDDIFYDTRTTQPVPMLSMGYEITAEQQILCMLSEGLKERLKM